MNILIDWDNLPSAETRKGAKYIVEKVLLAVASKLPSPPRRVSARLYGGWYARSQPTRRAQTLAVDLQQNFPATLTMPAAGGPHKLIVGAELAYALSATPNAHLFHTFRSRRGAGVVRVDSRCQSGCGRSGCFRPELHQLLDTRQCPVKGCRATADDILVKPEQKLVDSMLGVDLVHCAATDVDAVLVSDDDDLLPMVQYALVLGGRVYHVYSTRQLNSFYEAHLRGHKGTYSCCKI